MTDRNQSRRHPVPMPTRCRLRLLDGFALEVGGRVCHPQLSGQRLLALLTISGPTGRVTAAGTLWPEASEPHALGSLRTAIWRLHSCSPGLVLGDADHLRLSPAVEVDIHTVVQRATRLINTEIAHDDDLDIGPLRGRELLPGWYDDWVGHERERLRQLRMHALEALAAQLGSRGHYAAGLEAALEAVRMEPLRESSHRAVIALHLAEGNVAEAVRHFDAFRTALFGDLGVEPSPRLVGMLVAVPERTRPARLTSR
ncbi:MAG: AfsR/SARP family transcriptional regulator [Pseudonocardiaceae bacterium]